jgi:hypothetical protein
MTEKYELSIDPITFGDNEIGKHSVLTLEDTEIRKIDISKVDEKIAIRGKYGKGVEKTTLIININDGDKYIKGIIETEKNENKYMKLTMDIEPNLDAYIPIENNVDHMGFMLDKSKLDIFEKNPIKKITIGGKESNAKIELVKSIREAIIGLEQVNFVSGTYGMVDNLILGNNTDWNVEYLFQKKYDAINQVKRDQNRVENEISNLNEKIKRIDKLFGEHIKKDSPTAHLEKIYKILIK